MDDERTTDWRALSASLANAAKALAATAAQMEKMASAHNLSDMVRRFTTGFATAAHRLELTVVNMASDPNLPDVVERFPAVLAEFRNAARRLELTVVNMTSDPNIPDVVRRSPAFLAAVRDAELLDMFLEQLRQTQRLAFAELVFRVGAGNAEVSFRSEHAKAWLLANLPAGWTLVPNDNLVVVDATAVDDLVRRAKVDNLAVSVVEA
jgi:hypothetical protein